MLCRRYSRIVSWQMQKRGSLFLCCVIWTCWILEGDWNWDWDWIRKRWVNIDDDDVVVGWVFGGRTHHVQFWFPPPSYLLFTFRSLIESRSDFGPWPCSLSPRRCSNNGVDEEERDVSATQEGTWERGGSCLRN